MTEEKHTPPADDPADELKRSLSVIGAELYKMMQQLAPPEAQAHFKAAHVETLKGLRALIDSRIEHLSAERKKGTTINVE